MKIENHRIIFDRKEIFKQSELNIYFFIDDKLYYSHNYYNYYNTFYVKEKDVFIVNDYTLKRLGVVLMNKLELKGMIQLYKQLNIESDKVIEFLLNSDCLNARGKKFRETLLKVSQKQLI